MNWDIRRGTITVPASDTVTAGTATEVLYGNLGHLFLSVPALEGTGTATVIGTQPLGGTIYASTAINESTLARVAPYGTPAPFAGTLFLVATTTGDPAGTQSTARNIAYNIYYETTKG